jgi:hypothetical protein
MPVPSPAVHGPASQSLQHSAHTSPSNQSVISSAGRPLTVSSLAGEYVYAVIQVTRDLQPVVCSDWMLKGVDFDLCVSDVTLPQFETLALRLGTFLDLANSPPQNWPEAVSTSMLSLTQLLNVRDLDTSWLVLTRSRHEAFACNGWYMPRAGLRSPGTHGKGQSLLSIGHECLRGLGPANIGSRVVYKIIGSSKNRLHLVHARYMCRSKLETTELCVACVYV